MKSICPECGNIMEVPPESTGKMGRCNQCRSLFRIQRNGLLRKIGTATTRKLMTDQSAIWTKPKSFALAAAGIGLVAAMVSLSLLWFARSGYQEIKADLHDRDAEIERLEHEVRFVPRLRKQLSIQEKELEDANGALALARNQSRAREAELAAVRTELQSVKARLDKTKEEKNTEADSLRKALSSMKAQKDELDSEVLALRRQVTSRQAQLKARKRKDDAEEQ